MLTSRCSIRLNNALRSAGLSPSNQSNPLPPCKSCNPPGGCTNCKGEVGWFNQCDVVANRPDYNGMLYEERGRRILAHTGEKVVIDPKGQPWVVGQFPLKAFPPDEWHDYRVLVEGNHQRHWIDGHATVDVVDLDEKGRKLDGVLAVQVHVGPPMTIQYKDFLLKVLPNDLPLIKHEEVVIPPNARKVAPQGQDEPRKPDTV
jgi:Domain of Unknown Function (DUF1080)